MNLYMKRAEFEQLGFRDELKGEPVPDAYYRIKGTTKEVVLAVCHDYNGHLWRWECYGVDLDQ